MDSGKPLLAAAVFSLLAASAQAVPAYPAPMPAQQDVVIGIFDEAGRGDAISDPRVTVLYRSFHPRGTVESEERTDGGISHGDSVALSAIDEVHKVDSNARIRIVSAGVFHKEVLTTEGDGSRFSSRKLDRDAAIRALHWFKEHDVKVISMAFVAPNTDDLQEIVKTGYSMGFVMVAPTPNKLNHPHIWPAAYPEVISVSGISPELPLAKGQMTWGSIAIDGEVKFSMNGKRRRDFGSSMASGRLAGVISYYFLSQPSADVLQVRKFLHDASEMKMVTQDAYRTSDVPKVAVFNYKVASRAVPDADVFVQAGSKVSSEADALIGTPQRPRAWANKLASIRN